MELVKCEAQMKPKLYAVMRAKLTRCLKTLCCHLMTRFCVGGVQGPTVAAKDTVADNTTFREVTDGAIRTLRNRQPNVSHQVAHSTQQLSTDRTNTSNISPNQRCAWLGH